MTKSKLVLNEDIYKMISCAQEYLMDQGYSVMPVTGGFLARLKDDPMRWSCRRSSRLSCWANCYDHMYKGNMTTEESEAIREARGVTVGPPTGWKNR